MSATHNQPREILWPQLDIDEVRKHWGLLNHGAYGCTEIVLIDDNGKLLIGFFDDVELLIAALGSHWDKHTYAGINPRPAAWADNRFASRKRSKDTNIEMVSGVLLDVDPMDRKPDELGSPEDHEAALRVAWKIAQDHSGAVIDSGGGAYVHLAFEPRPVEELDGAEQVKGQVAEWQRQLEQQYDLPAQRLKIDATHDLVHVFRLAGTHNHKGDGRPCRIMSLPSELADDALEEILAIEVAETTSAEEIAFPVDALPDRFEEMKASDKKLQDLFEKPAPDSDQSKRDVALACHCLENSLTEEETATVVWLMRHGKRQREASAGKSLSRQRKYVLDTVRWAAEQIRGKATVKTPCSDFGPSVISAFLRGEDLPVGLVFGYADRQWYELLEKLKATDDPQAAIEGLATKTIRQQIEKAGAIPPPGRHRPVYSIADLLTCDLPVPPNVVGDFVPGESVNVVAGVEGIGKSYLMLDLCIAVAAGKSWQGIPVLQTPVLLVDRENRAVRLKQRVLKLGGTADLPLIIVEQMMHNLDSDEFVDELVYLRLQAGAGLIVLDPLADFLGEVDENSNSEMARVARRLREVTERSGAPVAVVHHVPKSNAGTSTQTLRGASALAGGVDVVTQVTQYGDVLTIKQKKNRIAEPLTFKTKMIFTDDNLTFERIGEVERGQPELPMNVVDQAILDVLEDGDWHQSNKVKSAVAEATGKTERTVRTHLKQLSERALIETEPRVPSQEAGKPYSIRRI